MYELSKINGTPYVREPLPESMLVARRLWRDANRKTPMPLCVANAMNDPETPAEHMRRLKSYAFPDEPTFPERTTLSSEATATTVSHHSRFSSRSQRPSVSSASKTTTVSISAEPTTTTTSVGNPNPRFTRFYKAPISSASGTSTFTITTTSSTGSYPDPVSSPAA